MSEKEEEMVIDSSHINLWLLLHAGDLDHDERLGITGPLYESRLDFHDRLFAFVNEGTHAERYRLVKIVEQDGER